MGNALGTGLAAAIRHHRDNHHDKKVHQQLCREGVLSDDSCTDVNKNNEKANKNLKNDEILSSTDEQVAYCKTHPNDALVCSGLVAERKVILRWRLQRRPLHQRHRHIETGERCSSFGVVRRTSTGNPAQLPGPRLPRFSQTHTMTCGNATGQRESRSTVAEAALSLSQTSTYLEQFTPS